MNKARHLCPECMEQTRKVYFRMQKQGRDEKVPCGYYCEHCKKLIES